MGVQSLISLWFGLTLPAIVLLYLLKRTYIDTEISSHLLWNRTLRQLEANRPWQKLRNQLLLLLQLFIAALLVLALLQPFLWTGRQTSGHVVLIVDLSASMMASDEQTTEGQAVTRLEMAKRQVTEWISSEGKQAEITLVTMRGQPDIVVSRERKHDVVTAALEQMVPYYGRTAYKETMSLAAALTREDVDSEIRIWTDGQWSETAAGLAFNVPVHVEKVGSSRANGSIVQFGVKPVETVLGLTSGIAVVKNSGDQILQGDLSLYYGSELGVVNPITLQPGEQRTIALEQLKAADYYRIVWDNGDIVQADNQSYAFPSVNRKPRALLVSNGNLFLEKALQLAQVDVVKVQPSESASIPLSLSEIDLIVMDSVHPDVLNSKEWQDRLQLKPVWLLNSPASATELTTIAGSYKLEDHPVNRYIRLQDTHIAKLIDPGVINWGKPIISIGSQPLIYAGLDRGNPRLLFTFDIRQSDLPLKPEFPILVQNSVDWLTHNKAGSLGRAIAGGKVDIAVSPRTVNAYWTPLDPKGLPGTPLLASKGDNGYFAQQSVPNRPGLYQFVEQETTDNSDRRTYLEVIADPVESNLTLMPDLAIRSGLSASGTGNSPVGEVGVGPDDGSLQPAQAENRRPYDIIPWIIILVLIIMAVEWGVYRRGHAV